MISIVFLLKKKKKMRKKKNYNPFTIKIVLAKHTCNVKQSIKEKKKKKKIPARKAKNINLIFFFIEEKLMNKKASKNSLFLQSKSKKETINFFIFLFF